METNLKNNDLIDISAFDLQKQFFTHEGYLHGIPHTYRVMCLTLLLGKRLEMPRERKLAFYSAYIHDMSRVDDGICRDHGRWAASEKLPGFIDFFKKHGLQKNDEDEIAVAVTNHSLPDDLEKNHPYCITTAILKDADALDRIRLGSWNLNKKFLRFEQSILLIDIAKEFFRATRNTNFTRLCEYAETLNSLVEEDINS